MTTGSYGSPSLPPYTNGLKGRWGWRSWSGDDGKYTSGALSAPKWNAYTCTQESLAINCCQTRFTCSRPGGGGDPYTGYTPQVYLSFPSEVSFGLSSNDVLKALNGLISEAKGHSWNMAVDLAQGRQTVGMAVNALGSFGRSIMALKHGDFATAARQLGVSPKPTRLKTTDVSGRWLELQYGWLPTLSSVYEASKAYEAITNGPRIAKFKASISKFQVIDHSPSPGVCFAKQKYRLSRTYTLEQSEDLSEQRSLGLYDPLSVAWELVPYSFVVDWFVPIGTYLSNLNQLSSLKGRWLVSQRLGTEGELSWSWYGGKSTYIFCGYHGFSHRYDGMSHTPSITRNGAVYSRSPLSGPPPLPFPSISGLPEAMSPKRILNAISLAHQRFLR